MRAATRKPSTCDSAVISSSAMPSQRCAWSRAGLMSTNGRTPIDEMTGVPRGRPSVLDGDAASSDATNRYPRRCRVSMNRGCFVSSFSACRTSCTHVVSASSLTAVSVQTVREHIVLGDELTGVCNQPLEDRRRLRRQADFAVRARAALDAKLEPVAANRTAGSSCRRLPRPILANRRHGTIPAKSRRSPGTSGPVGAVLVRGRRSRHTNRGVTVTRRQSAVVTDRRSAILGGWSARPQAHDDHSSHGRDRARVGRSQPRRAGEGRSRRHRTFSRSGLCRSRRIPAALRLRERTRSAAPWASIW